MDLQKIDEAIENLCEHLSYLTNSVLPVCTHIENACKIGTAAAEIGSSLAALLTARKLNEADEPGKKGGSDEAEE